MTFPYQVILRKKSPPPKVVGLTETAYEKGGGSSTLWCAPPKTTTFFIVTRYKFRQEAATTDYIVHMFNGPSDISASWAPIASGEFTTCYVETFEDFSIHFAPGIM